MNNRSGPQQGIANIEGNSVFITASELLEYLYCPRFIYFMNCLCIGQNEDKRFKVIKGREVHTHRDSTNRDYLRKKIGCVGKETSVYLSSEKYHIKGIVDEVLSLCDGSMAPFDYKFAEYDETVFSTYRYQSVFYGLLIRENYGKTVDKGFICYTRSNSFLKEITIREGDFAELQEMITEMLAIIQTGFYPAGTRHKAKCIDCCYRKICV